MGGCPAPPSPRLLGTNRSTKVEKGSDAMPLFLDPAPAGPKVGGFVLARQEDDEKDYPAFYVGANDDPYYIGNVLFLHNPFRIARTHALRAMTRKTCKEEDSIISESVKEISDQLLNSKQTEQTNAAMRKFLCFALETTQIGAGFLSMQGEGIEWSREQLKYLKKGVENFKSPNALAHINKC